MIAKAGVQGNPVCQIKDQWSCQVTGSLIRWSGMISLSSPGSWTDWELADVISRQIGGLLCITMLVSSSICSFKKSERTSTVINTESFTTLRPWKMFFVIINDMSEMKRKYVSAWFFVLFMISNAFNNFCLIDDLVKFSTRFSVYYKMCMLIQWLKKKIYNS